MYDVSAIVISNRISYKFKRKEIKEIIELLSREDEKMIRIIKGNDKRSFIKDLQKRNAQDYNDVYDIVDKIIEDVRVNKDEAVKKYTLQFDKVNIENLK